MKTHERIKLTDELTKDLLDTTKTIKNGYYDMAELELKTIIKKLQELKKDSIFLKIAEKIKEEVK